MNLKLKQRYHDAPKDTTIMLRHDNKYNNAVYWR